jgi:hypothetical protein
MDVFFLLTGFIAAMAVAAVLVSHVYYRDTLHPLILTIPVSTFLYVYMPIDLYLDGELLRYFDPDELGYVQGLNVACLAALGLGVVVGSRRVRRDDHRRDVHFFQLTDAWQSRLYTLTLVLGGIGFLLYVYQLSNAGGFVAAYDTPKGGGRAASGYLRDFTILTLPAVILLFLSRFRKVWRLRDTVLVILFSSPHLVHGLLSARRGPTFLGIVVLVAGWYLARYRRPKLWKLFAGGAALGTLLLILVTFRGEIYLGSEFFTAPPEIGEVVGKSVGKSTEASYGNEFVYGTQAVLLADEVDHHFWGTRYLTYLFIRPIPGFLWPTKYQDVGMEALLSNAGVIPFDAGAEITESIPPGAAPGFVADFFVEFAWGAIFAALAVGIAFGTLWRYNLLYGGVWTVIYGSMIGLSLYFVTQTFGAFLFRALEIGIVVYVAWRYAERKFKQDIARSKNLTATTA